MRTMKMLATAGMTLAMAMMMRDTEGSTLRAVDPMRSNVTWEGVHVSECDPSKWKIPTDGKYDTRGRIAKDKLNVHLIPHTHDDPGWLITVDQYYFREVQYILDTTIDELVKNPDRKFMYVEQSFFQRWWVEQNDDMKDVVKKLVREGRLDLSVNGGWCMHDEATAHYTAMVDQTAYGHKFLKEEFGVTPRIGWQIDPFGHSSTQGSLLSGGVGFDALYFARIDYQDYDNRVAHKDMEFIWRPSKSRGKAMQVFTGAMLDHYGAPDHFDYNHDVLQDDPRLHDFNICDQVNDFVEASKKRASALKGNHIFIPMGNDFSYQNARTWYKNMDKLIHYVNQDGRINVLYSNLSQYTDLKLAEGLKWSVKTDDFFPYGSQDHEYWTGYFTSRPTLKRFARVGNQLLQQMRQIDAVYMSHHQADLDKLKRGVGVTQHHDGISGTEKQHVANDYALRINEGIVQAEKELNDILFVIGDKEKYQFCLQTNISICDVSTTNAEFEMVAFNALPRNTIRTITIPLNHKSAKVTSSTGAKVDNVVVYKTIAVHPESQREAPYHVTFTTQLGPLALHRFHVQQNGGEDGHDDVPQISKNLVLENDVVQVEIDKDTGSTVSLTNKAKKITVPLTLSAGYYRSFQGDGRHSGAYMFRPDSKTVYPVTTKLDQSVKLLSVDTNPSGTMSRVAFKLGNWTTLEYILNNGDHFLEVQHTVGPIPIGDNQGKEVILRLDTAGAIKSAAKWYTDSNGLEFVERVRNHRDTWNLTLHDDQEVVTANYFPITTGVYIKDNVKQLNIAVDRAHGVASLQDGQLEIMVHRRCLMDDEKGVAENLNETETFYDPKLKKDITTGLVARGSFFINVDDAREGVRSLRSKVEKELYAPLLAFRKSAPSTSTVEEKLPWLTVTEFPENVGLTTLEELSKDSLLVRLTHLYAVDEHPELSKPCVFDFSKYFSAKNAVVNKVVELTLTGTNTLASTRPTKGLDLKANNEADDAAPALLSIPVQGSVVQLQAMEVRAFRVTFGKKDEVIRTSRSYDPVSMEEYTDRAVEFDFEEKFANTIDDAMAIE